MQTRPIDAHWLATSENKYSNESMYSAKILSIVLVKALRDSLFFTSIKARTRNNTNPNNTYDTKSEMSVIARLE